MRVLRAALITAAGLCMGMHSNAAAQQALSIGITGGSHGLGVASTIRLHRILSADLLYEGTLPSTRAIVAGGLQIDLFRAVEATAYIRPSMGLARCLNDLNRVRCRSTDWSLHSALSGGVGIYLDTDQVWLATAEAGYVRTPATADNLSHAYGSLRIMLNLGKR